MSNMPLKREYDLVKETAKVYQHVLWYAPDGFLLVDMDGRILDANESFCKMLGYNRKEMLRLSIADVEAFEKSPDVLKHLQKIKKRGSDRFITRHRDRWGSLVDVEVSVFYSGDLGGLLVVFVRDMRKQKEAERVLEETREKAKRSLEQLLVDSYKHIGVINRKISLLLEMEKSPRLITGKREMTEYALRIAMKVSGSKIGFVYALSGRGRYHLLACRGLEKSEQEKILEMSSRKTKLLCRLYKEKKRLNGNVQQCKIGLPVIEKKSSYFVVLPLLKEAIFAGFILLGFSKRKSMDTQDLEFLDIFALHTSKALCRMKVF